ncbi:MAG: S53 family peptidase, partial [Terriglobales bacterium]
MSTPPKRLPLPGSERTPMEGAREVGPANPNEQVEVTVRLRSRAGSRSMPEAEFAKPPSERAVLSRAEFASRHGADPSDIARVEAYARAHHLTVKETSAARRTVILTGTVAAMNAAFGVELKQYEDPTCRYRGRTGAIHLPEDLHGIVEGVFGLDNRPQAKTHFRRRRARAGAHAAAASASFTPPQVAALYDFPTRVNGSGECIALIELGGGYTASDLSAYWKQLKLTIMPKVSAVSVGNGSNKPTGDPNSADGEVMLDIEVAGSIAPGAKIVAYFAENTDAGFLNAITTA